MVWDWKSPAGRRVGLRVDRRVSLEGRGVVLGVTTLEDPDVAPRLEVYLSEGGQSLRVWLDGEELTE